MRRLRSCRGCGCDDNHACLTVDGPCSWILLDVEMPTGVCSACAEAWDWNQRDLAIMGTAYDDEEAA